ncbi:MAG: acylphosphatase [Candidatus Hydrothermota bacterium]|nr:MAG: acylphosphatase [Candidatus Hydrothermae bacterium]
MKAVHIIVHGVVQGVGFRYFVWRRARAYNIHGWVRNRPDGTVEILAQGEEGMLNEFIKEVKIGPPAAHVTRVDIQESSPDFTLNDFEIRF